HSDREHLHPREGRRLLGMDDAALPDPDRELHLLDLRRGAPRAALRQGRTVLLLPALAVRGDRLPDPGLRRGALHAASLRTGSGGERSLLMTTAGRSERAPTRAAPPVSGKMVLTIRGSR